MTSSSAILRQIPSVDRVLNLPATGALLDRFPRNLVVETIHDHLRQWRPALLEGRLTADQLPQLVEELPGRVGIELEQRLQPSLRRLINATGVLLHTNAGRAPIAAAIARQVTRLAAGYSNLEYDLANGRRGHRDRHLEGRFCRLLGCEAATICNNNAGAVFLILNTLANGKEVLVSRGELVEIGGSFRIPAIMEKSGALLREVGTTNKTRLEDYQAAIGDNTGLILRVHPSNFRVVGFTAAPTLKQLVQLSRESGIPLVKDAGSGLLFASRHIALRREPSVQAALEAGVDLVCFSGDKLLGGPQAGIVVGGQHWITQLRQNPLMRILRADKMTCQALELTLIEYERQQETKTVPVQHMLHQPVAEIRRRAEMLLGKIKGYDAELLEGSSLVGGGSAPGEEIPTVLIALKALRHSAQALQTRLRQHRPSILVRIEVDRVLIDLRTVSPAEEADLLGGLLAVAP